MGESNIAREPADVQQKCTLPEAFSSAPAYCACSPVTTRGAVGLRGALLVGVVLDAPILFNVNPPRSQLRLHLAAETPTEAESSWKCGQRWTLHLPPPQLLLAAPRLRPPAGDARRVYWEARGRLLPLPLLLPLLPPTLLEVVPEPSGPLVLWDLSSLLMLEAAMPSTAGRLERRPLPVGAYRWRSRRAVNTTVGEN